MFTGSCLYTLPEPDNLDWNKLFGAGFGWNHHENSVRFAWRAGGIAGGNGKNMVEVGAYSYLKGERFYPEAILQMEVGKPFTAEIIVENGIAEFWIDGAYLLEALPIGDAPKWGFLLGPYFGGNNPAPTDIEILIS